MKPNIVSSLPYLQAAAALLLQIFLLTTLIRQGGKRYSLLTLYAAILFLSTVMEMSIRFSPDGWSATARQYYWTSEIIQQTVAVATILWLERRASHGPLASAPAARWLAPVSALAVVLSLWLNHDSRLNFWMTSVSRDLSFLVILLNLVLWTSLLKAKIRQPRMLMVSGGLGIMFAGQAMGQGLRLLYEHSRALFWGGNVVVSLSYLIALFVLYRAFHHPEVSPGMPGSPGLPKALH